MYKSIFLKAEFKTENFSFLQIYTNIYKKKLNKLLLKTMLAFIIMIFLIQRQSGQLLHYKLPVNCGINIQAVTYCR